MKDTWWTFSTIISSGDIRRETVDYLAEMSALSAVVDGLNETRLVVRVVA